MPQAEKFDADLRVVVTRAMKAKIEARAHALELSVSAWCRRVLKRQLAQLERDAACQSDS